MSKKKKKEKKLKQTKVKQTQQANTLQCLRDVESLLTQKNITEVLTQVI